MLIEIEEVWVDPKTVTAVYVVSQNITMKGFVKSQDAVCIQTTGGDIPKLVRNMSLRDVVNLINANTLRKELNT